MSKFWAEPSISPELSQLLYTSKLLSFKGEILISGNTLHSICMMQRNASMEEQNLCKSCEHNCSRAGVSQQSKLIIRMTKRNYEYFQTWKIILFFRTSLLSYWFSYSCFLKIEICSLFLFLNGFSVKWPRCGVHTFKCPSEVQCGVQSHCRMLLLLGDGQNLMRTRK